MMIESAERDEPMLHGSGPMSREEVRSRLRSVECSGTAAGTPAAVLIGLVARPDGPHVILTERTAHLKNHAGQVSFPGGSMEANDAGPKDAALREAFEEIGLPPHRIELLGCLPPHETITGFRVHPFVGWVEPPVEFVLDCHEVAEVFEVPLGFVLDSANHVRETEYLEGAFRTYYVLHYNGHRIWGATAEMLVTLAGVLAPWAFSRGPAGLDGTAGRRAR